VKGRGRARREYSRAQAAGCPAPLGAQSALRKSGIRPLRSVLTLSGRTPFLVAGEQRPANSSVICELLAALGGIKQRETADAETVRE
jgi:hypothetical protein